MRTAFSTPTTHYLPQEAMARAGQPPNFDVPARIQSVLDRIAEVGLGAVEESQQFDLTPLRRVHSTDYLDFLERAWLEWPRERSGEVALPQFWPSYGMRSDPRPRSIVGQLGIYAGDSIAPLMASTWASARASADAALTAQRWMRQGERAAFALCRPPGHHAAADKMAGYCYINNAAVAAQAFIDSGAARVAILDVDYHHGNGTQSIFYDRADVLFASVHADPLDDYPYFQGHADEVGRGEGLGFNLNCPLAMGAGWEIWSAALSRCCERITGFRPTVLVVSLGVDAHQGDPSGSFKLASEDFVSIGQRIGGLDLPTLFVMEGGYDASVTGLNAVNVLQGFEAAQAAAH